MAEGLAKCIFLAVVALSFSWPQSGRADATPTFECPNNTIRREGAAELSPKARALGVSEVAVWCEREGLRDGPYVERFKSGQRFREIWYLRGEQSGPYREYDVGGSVLSSGQFKSGKPTGNWTDYDLNGTVVGRYSYEERDGALWMHHTNYFPDGSKASESSDKDGELEGMMTTWYQDGSKRDEGEYRSGRQEGPWTFWYPKGHLQAKGSFSAGRKVGVWKEWLADGELDKTEDYSSPGGR